MLTPDDKRGRSAPNTFTGNAYSGSAYSGTEGTLAPLDATIIRRLGFNAQDVETINLFETFRPPHKAHDLSSYQILKRLNELNHSRLPLEQIEKLYQAWKISTWSPFVDLAPCIRRMLEVPSVSEIQHPKIGSSIASNYKISQKQKRHNGALSSGRTFELPLGKRYLVDLAEQVGRRLKRELLPCCLEKHPYIARASVIQFFFSPKDDVGIGGRILNSITTLPGYALMLAASLLVKEKRFVRLAFSLCALRAKIIGSFAPIEEARLGIKLYDRFFGF